MTNSEITETGISKRFYVVAVGIVGVVLSILGYLYSSALEQQHMQATIAQVTDDRRALLQNNVGNTVEILDAVGSFIGSNENINREIFQAFTQPILKRHPELWAIHWIPRVSSEDRSEFEQELFNQGFSGGITELLGVSNSIEPASDRSEYYPILFSEPLGRNKQVIGFDASSRNLNLQAMQAILNDNEHFLSSAPFKLVQDSEGSASVVFYSPVFFIQPDPENPEQRHKSIRGFIAALVKPQILLDYLAGDDQGVAMQLMDVSASSSFNIGSTYQEEIEPDWLVQIADFSTLGRQWQLALSISPDQVSQLSLRKDSQAIWVLIAGLGFTLALVFILRNLSRAHRQAIKERDRAQSYLDTVETIMMDLDKDGRVSMINRKGCELLGRHEREIVGQLWFRDEFVPNSSRKALQYQQLMQSALSSKAKCYSESQVRNAAGDELLIAWNNTIQLDQQGQPSGILSAGADITQQRYAQILDQNRSRAMQATLQGESLSHVLELVLTGIEQQKLDAKCSILLLDDSGEHLLSCAAPSLPESYNKAIHGIKIGDGVGSCGTAAYRQERVVVEDIQSHPYWAPFKELAAEYKLGSCWSEPIFGKKGRLLGTFAIYHSTSSAPVQRDLDLINSTANFVSILIEEFQIEASLLRMAHTDELTGLSNRRKFLECLENEFIRAGRYGHPLSLCMLDIDHFKKINDQYGHDAGDEVLRQLADMLQDLLRETDMPGRIGGEEFGLLLPDTDQVGASIVSERIRKTIADLKVTIRTGEQLSITASIGVTVLSESGEPVQQSSELISRADRCLYFAKQNGRNQVSFSSANMNGLK